MFGKSSKNGPCKTCRTLDIVYLAFGVLTVLLTLAGVIKAHFPIPGEGMVIGTTTGSLALLAFVLSLFFVKKMGSCCPCQCSVSSKK